MPDEMDQIVAKYKEVQKINDEMTIARNAPDEFYKILRRAFQGKNANVETYGEKFDYKGNVVDAKYLKELVDKLQSDQEFRFKNKNDREKTNITDAPGFGSVRLTPPYEDQGFDKEFFQFCSAIIDENDEVIDYGGGCSPFLIFLPKSKKRLVDKNNLGDAIAQYDIAYQDADEFEVNPDQIIFCFHTLEHMDNPEEMITKLSKAGVFIFATPHEELINTSIYHYVFMQIPVFKKIFEKNKSVAFMRRSKSGLDIHGIVINSPSKWNFIKDNMFFKKNFRIYTEL